MIDERDDVFDSKITLHDRHRFEIKLDMDLGLAARPAYELESYFFVPRALNISPRTYTKEDFYNSNQRYIRFKTPRISLSKLCDPELSTSPLNRVKDNLSRILSGSQDTGLVNQVYDEFKLLGCVIRGEIRDHVKSLTAELAASAARPEESGGKVFPGESFTAFLSDLKRLVDTIHALKAEVMDPAVPSSMAMVLNSAAKHPRRSMACLTRCPTWWRWTWPGTNWVNELTTAITGLPICSSRMPLARHSARAPAILLPSVVAALRSGIVISHSSIHLVIFFLSFAAG